MQPPTEASSPVTGYRIQRGVADEGVRQFSTLVTDTSTADTTCVDTTAGKRFSEACLRITSKLDMDGVLQEVIDSACELTGARYGALISFDYSGDIGDLVTSGITPEERQRMGSPPKGLGILRYLNEIENPLRLADIASHPRAVGFPKNHPPMKTFLGSPVRYQGERLGNIYLTEKEDGREFSQEDEDILVMFATQAALVIANARKHLEETRARADLEALVNISPVGVLVFDAKTGGLLSINEETRRIVGKLNAPGRGLSDLLEMMTLRTPEGREIPIDDLPTTRAIRSGETIHSDEVVIHLRDGRSIRTLVNARPIQREDGEIVSVVATLQDITPLEEMKRQRTEFLGRLSHELRTPLTAIKGSVASVLGSSYPPGAVETRQFLRIMDEQADHMRRLINDIVDMTQIESGTLSVDLRPTSMEDAVHQAKEAFVRDAAADRIELELAPDLPRIMADGQRIFQVLGILLENASEHSSESSTIRWCALRGRPVRQSIRGGRRSRTVRRSTANTAVAFSWANSERTGTSNGRNGLSLAICRGIVEAHGGRMSVEIGGLRHGVRFHFTVPAVDEPAYGAEDGSTTANGNSRATDQAPIPHSRSRQRS